MCKEEVMRVPPMNQERRLQKDLPYWHLDHGFPRLQNSEKSISVVQPSSVWNFVTAALEDHAMRFIQYSVFDGVNTNANNR